MFVRKTFLLCCFILTLYSPAVLPLAAHGAEGIVITCETDGELPPYRVMTKEGLAGFEIDLYNAIFRDSPYLLRFQAEIWGTDITHEGPPAAELLGWKEVGAEISDRIDLTAPVYFYRYGAFTRPDLTARLNLDSLGAYEVGVTKNSFPLRSLRSRGFTGVRSFENGEEALRALLDGTIEVLFDDVVSSRYIQTQQGADKFTLYHPELEVPVPVSIGVRKGNAALLFFINKRLETMKKNGEYEMIYGNHFLSHSPFYENRRREIAFKTAAALVAIFSVLGAFAAFLYYRQLLLVEREKAFADTLIENAMSFILIWDENLNIVRANTRVERVLGYTKDELEDMKASDIIQMPNSIANYSLTMRMKPRSGDAIDVFWDINRFSRDDGKHRFVMAAGSDITEIVSLRRSLETSLEKLRESERRFELATSGGNVGIISCDMEKNEVYISPVGYKLLGYSKHPSNLTNEEWLSRIHPEDIDIFQLNVFSVENAASQNPSSEIRIRRKDGEYKWFLFSFKALLNDLGRMTVLSGAFLDIDERKRMELLTRRLAFEDPVSGTRNRHYLMTEGEKLLIKAQRNNLGVGLIIFDIDGFKLLNMEKGTAAGDRLLREVGTRAKALLGTVGLLARLSGDEFICLLPVDSGPGVTDKLSAAIAALKNAIMKIDAAKYGMKSVTVCAGSSLFPLDSTELSGLIENASVSLVAAKGQGPSSMKIYDSNVKNSARRDEILRRDIQNLIQNNQLETYYQPKIDLSTGLICGAEALARWNHPDFGVIRPDYFIKIAEDIGVITAVDTFLIRETCAQNVRWQSLGLRPIRIAVNMSAEGFFSEKALDTVRSILDETKLDAKWLEIELTESQAMHDIQKAIASMRKLEKLGVMVSLDDFGTGYSSLNYMKKLPIKMIKLDRSFILDIESNPTSQMIVNTIVQLSKKLNLKVTVEGVENSLQELHLKNIGCEYAQGYLYSKPVPADKFELLLRSRKPLGQIENRTARKAVR